MTTGMILQIVAAILTLITLYVVFSPSKTPKPPFPHLKDKLGLDIGNVTVV